MSEKPSAAELLSDPNIIAAMQRAYQESDVGGPNPTEQGGYVLRSVTSSGFEVERLPAGQRDSLSYPICTDGRYNGRDIVATFHTHPNTGAEWSQAPSPQDVRLSKGLSGNDGFAPVRHQRGDDVSYRQ